MFEQSDSSNRLEVNGCSSWQLLRHNLSWFSPQHRKTLFLRSFMLKSTERVQVLLRQRYQGFLAFFYVTITENFLKNENLFFKKKLENSFIVENTTIEIVTYPYKTVLSEANVKTNRMDSTRWTYRKERSFAIVYFIFWKILVQYKNLLYGVDLKYQLPKCPYSYFPKVLESYLRVLFPCKYP